MALMRIITILSAVIIPVACAPSLADLQKQREAYYAELKAQLALVYVADGVDREEALVISENYYRRFTHSACGGVGELLESEDQWQRVVHMGVGGIPIDDRIIIQKKTGSASWKRGRTVEDPRTIWQYEKLPRDPR